jgi:hypothetical protein
MLHCFGFTGTPAYREFNCGCCEVHVGIPPQPSDPSLKTWFTTATGDDLGDTMERAAHRALTEFYECHLSNTTGTIVALLPILDLGNLTWSGRLAAACDPTRPTYHAG